MMEKDIGQYPILTEVINELSEKLLDERSRHLAIALGLVFGSAEAYRIQERGGQKVYFRNFTVDEAFEGGLVAEEVRDISQNPERLEEKLRNVSSLFNGSEPKGCSMQRLYGIFRNKKPNTEEELRRLGSYVEQRVKDWGGKSFQVKREETKEENFLGVLEIQIVQQAQIDYQRQRGEKQLEEMSWLNRCLRDYYELNY